MIKDVSRGGVNAAAVGSNCGSQEKPIKTVSRHSTSLIGIGTQL